MHDITVRHIPDTQQNTRILETGHATGVPRDESTDMTDMLHELHNMKNPQGGGAVSSNQL